MLKLVEKAKETGQGDLLGDYQEVNVEVKSEAVDQDELDAF